MWDVDLTLASTCDIVVRVESIVIVILDSNSRALYQGLQSVPMKSSKELGFPLAYTPAQRTRISRLTKHLAFFSLLSLAVCASILFPSRWNFLNANRSLLRPVPNSYTLADPSSEFKDDIWPLRSQTPWDISTDYPYPRLLEYDVTEGTWLRLDVHPTTGDIIFDILGDIYCLPSHAYSSEQLTSGTEVRARPVLLGIPHDSDPHFSPDGHSFVFRSDAGLGVENIWITAWQGCEDMDIRPTSINDAELALALSMKKSEEELLASGVQETEERKRRRLLREGRFAGRDSN